MMKQSIDIHQDILNNSQRPYFGLDSIDPKWDEVEIKPGYTVFFDGNVIKKVISFTSIRSHRAIDEYREYDTELPTRDRQFVLPKTARGKEKKLNYTSVNTVTPTGIVFSLTTGDLRPSLGVSNPRNAISLPLSEEDFEPKTIEEFQKWRDAYITDSPPDHFEKVDRMRNLPHRTIKYFNGDIFRFEIGREHYGFGIIIGQIRKMQKDGIIPEHHALNHVMMVPLLVRYYQIKTKDREPAMETITSSPLLPTEIMSDGPVLWGSVDIIGSKQLQADDIDFPMHVGRTCSGKRDNFCFCWGIGMMVTKKTSDMPNLKDTRYPHGGDFYNNGVYCGVNTSIVLRAMRGEYPLAPWSDICHPDNSSHKEAVFQYLQLPLDISFDEFNSQHEGMTRQQYADYANKYLRVEKNSTPSKKSRSSSQKQ